MYSNTIRVAAGGVLAACFAVAVGSGVGAQEPEASAYSTEISVAEIMESMVMPAAQKLWDAVGVDVTEQGEIETKPETDEQWMALRAAAITLAEAANTIVMPGRHAAPADEVALEGELSPAEVDALIAKQRAAWTAYARVLHATAMQAVAAVDARSTAAIYDLGGTLDEACEACHKQFWYPEQQ